MKEKAIEYFKFYRKKFCEDHLKILPKDSIAYQATLKEKEFYDIAIKALEQQPCEDEIEKHTDRQIYDGCIHLMQKMVDYFQEYLEYLGYDLDKLDEDERFAVGISNMEIVQWLFLFHTRNSGGCSTRDFCESIGIDDSKSVKFEFERVEE